MTDPKVPVAPWSQGSSIPADPALARLDVDALDERLTRSGAPETRGDYSARQDAEREEMLHMSDAEFEAMVEAEFDNAVLANPPKLQGYHLCWLTTTSQYDTLQKRHRVGYIPVMRSEMPHFDASMGKDLVGHEGHVTCNELVLHKILDRRYQTIMNLFHHKKPSEAMRSIVKSNEDAGANVVDDGDSVEAGFTTLERSVKFADKIGDNARFAA
jgi:hypothetical protein